MFTRFNKVPDAYADFPDIEGTVTFYGVHGGTVVVVNLRNLPTGNQFHALHIHAGDSCTWTQEEPFKNADGHYNPTNMPHPNHVGDLPPILSADGMAFLVFYTNRFYPEDVVGRTIILHALPDDFNSQPSGNAGAMIACGEIKEIDHSNPFHFQ